MTKDNDKFPIPQKARPGFTPDGMMLVDVAEAWSHDPAAGGLTTNELFESLVQSFWRGDFETPEGTMIHWWVPNDVERRIFEKGKPTPWSRSIVFDAMDKTRLKTVFPSEWYNESEGSPDIYEQSYQILSRQSLSIYESDQIRFLFRYMYIRTMDLRKWFLDKGVPLPNFLEQSPQIKRPALARGSARPRS